VNKIPYPYQHPEITFEYTESDNKFMQAAKEAARNKSLDATMPTGTVLVKNGEIIGQGANGSDYHESNGCERVRLGIPTGQGYDLCEGCSPKNHSEPRAIEDARANGNDPEGAEAVLWGHWWCCESCCTTMVTNGIKKVILMKDSEVLFNKDAADNIVGRQFEVA
jgi:deoxycytidylate deaminase